MLGVYRRPSAGAPGSSGRRMPLADDPAYGGAMRKHPAFTLPVVLLPVVLLLAGCSGGPDPDSVIGIPSDWLQDTADGWPDSDAFGTDIPVYDDSDCVLGDVVPDILGDEPDAVDSGWGSYGDDASAAGAYRYVCEFFVEDRYAGSLQLIQAPDAATAATTLDEFANQTDTTEQDNTVTTVEVGRLEMQVLARWYPTNPQGEYQAMYVDADHDAIVVLEVNSLDEDDYGSYSDDQAAQDLLEALAAGS